MLILHINSDPTEIKPNGQADFISLIERGGVLATAELIPEVGFNEQLLQLIEKVLKEGGRSLNQLSVIAVVASGGTFSSLRATVATANGLAFALNIPVVKIAKSTAVEEIVNRCQAMDGTGFTGSIMPEYDREPNITKAKDVKVV